MRRYMHCSTIILRCLSRFLVHLRKFHGKPFSCPRYLSTAYRSSSRKSPPIKLATWAYIYLDICGKKALLFLNVYPDFPAKTLSGVSYAYDNFLNNFSYGFPIVKSPCVFGYGGVGLHLRCASGRETADARMQHIEASWRRQVISSPYLHGRVRVWVNTKSSSKNFTVPKKILRTLFTPVTHLLSYCTRERSSNGSLSTGSSRQFRLH